MDSVRFGKIVVMHKFTKEMANRLTSPNTRVVYEANNSRAYVVNGQEDMAMVDDLILNRKQAIQDGVSAVASEINNSLYRFLLKGAYSFKPKMDTVTPCQLELLV